PSWLRARRPGDGGGALSLRRGPAVPRRRHAGIRRTEGTVRRVPRSPPRGVPRPGGPRPNREVTGRRIPSPMTASWHTLLDVAIRTSVVYVALLAGLRLTGTRQFGQMSTFDLVLLLIIANAVQNAMVGPDTSLAGGLVAAGVLIGWHRVIDWCR